MVYTPAKGGGAHLCYLKYFNPAAEELFGYKAEEIIGRTVPEVHAMEGRDPGKFIETMKHIREHGYFVHEFSMERKGGETRLVKFSVTNILDDREKPKGFVAMVQDLTMQRQMEKQIIVAKKHADFSVMAGGLAHDFNNLLQIIHGSMLLMTDKLRDDAQLLPMLTYAEQSILQAIKLSHSMQILSRGGYWPTATIDLLPIIAKRIKEIKMNNIRLRTDLRDDLWRVDVNEDLFTMAFNNIIENALHAMRDGGILMISTENLPAEPDAEMPLSRRDRIKIVIADTGMGIPGQHIDHIFDPYYATKKTWQSEGAGAGACRDQGRNGNPSRGNQYTVEREKWERGYPLPSGDNIIRFREKYAHIEKRRISQ